MECVNDDAWVSFFLSFFLSFFFFFFFFFVVLVMILKNGQSKVVCGKERERERERREVGMKNNGCK